jgi:hypothetical protein
VAISASDGMVMENYDIEKQLLGIIVGDDGIIFGADEGYYVSVHRLREY